MVETDEERGSDGDGCGWENSWGEGDGEVWGERREGAKFVVERRLKGGDRSGWKRDWNGDGGPREIMATLEAVHRRTVSNAGTKLRATLHSTSAGRLTR